jgi:drug/metabolite transporter (DMT)-like permease
MPANPPNKSLILLAFACVYLCWGSTYLAIRVAGMHIAPPLVAGLRTLISAVIVAAICLARRTSLRVSAADAWRLILIGILFMSVNNVLLTWAETRVASGFAALVIAQIPILIALIETALPRGERLPPLGWLGILLGAIGMLTLLWPSLHPTGTQPTGAQPAGDLLGFLLLFLAALAFAVGSVFSRRHRFTGDPFVSTTWQLASASIVNFTIATAGGTLRTAQWTRSGVLAIVYLAIFGSVVGLTASTYLLQHVPVTKVATYGFVNPVIAVLLGALILHEHLAPTELAGMAIIVTAVATVILSRTKSAPQLLKSAVAGE